MKNVFTQLIRFFKQIRGHFPEVLPMGVTTFNAFVDDVIATYNMPTPLRSDVLYVIAMNIVSAKREPADRMSKWFLFRQLRAAAAKQVAHEHMRQVYEAEKAKQKSAEATAIPAVASNGTIQ